MSDEHDCPDADEHEPVEPLSKLLVRLQLSNIRSHYHELAQTAAEQGWSHLEYLNRLIEGEVAHRDDKSLERRVRLARFPLVKTLDQFQWNWPKKINRAQIQHLFHLDFIDKKANVLFLSGTPGLGKTHLSIALGRAACSSGYSVLFTTAINMIQTLSAAAAVGAGELQHVMQRYLKPALLLCDEVGYLPIDKLGADLLFQVVSQRYERGSIVLTTNRPFKKWAQIFNNDSTLTSALLDRLLHHAEVVVIEGPSFRGKDIVDTDSIPPGSP
jgi:DNA replication protein DnaC